MSRSPRSASTMPSLADRLSSLDREIAAAAALLAATAPDGERRPTRRRRVVKRRKAAAAPKQTNKRVRPLPSRSREAPGCSRTASGLGTGSMSRHVVTDESRLLARIEASAPPAATFEGQLQRRVRDREDTELEVVWDGRK